jgi:glycosyltransferase involved in cell wall biosynthesis
LFYKSGRSVYPEYLKSIIKNPQYVFIQNLNKDYTKEFQKRVLISYITLPLISDLDQNISHTNYRELIQILNVFYNMDYQVDICHFQDPTVCKIIPHDKYDIVIGLGTPFEYACKVNPQAIKILYCTIQHPTTFYSKLIERVDYFEKRHNYRPDFFWHEYYPKDHFSCAEHLIFKGNDEIRKSFMHLNHLKTIQPIISCAFKSKDFSLNKQNFEQIKNNYLWFGSIGSIGKGLDILIDVFNTLPEKKLYIAGLVEKEVKKLPQFSSNIKNIGFIDLNSQKFIDIINECTFVIFPSCSEGMASGVLTCMNHGLIPIITKECGININPSIGFLLDDYKLETIKQKVNEVSQLNSDELEKLCQNVYNYTRENYNICEYSKQLELSVKNILSEQFK